MRASQAVHSIAAACRVLGVSVSGYHAWCRRAPSRRATEDAKLIARIRAINEMSDGTYGAPRIRAELVDVDGLTIGIRRVAPAHAESRARRRFPPSLLQCYSCLEVSMGAGMASCGRVREAAARCS